MIGKNTVLGVAAFWGKRKGLNDFIRLANDLPDEFTIVMVGATQDIRNILPERIITIERTNDPSELRALYSAADVFANPPIQDNFPTVNLEAAACGTPIVTYQTGGIPENAYTPTCVVSKNEYDT
ncbi:MAG: glycosyltransferase [Christensenellaceae bacterium]|nr:glycosyltransferase [Christensenellaceae bacterium]